MNANTDYIPVDPSHPDPLYAMLAPPPQTVAGAAGGGLLPLNMEPILFCRYFFKNCCYNFCPLQAHVQAHEPAADS